MPFDAIAGQVPAIETLTRALASGMVHHAYRFEGIDGVGKERAALAFAQALLCTAGERLGCGRCDACRRVVTLGEGTPPLPLHPDVIIVGRALYPPETIGGKKELAEISVEQIRRVVLARASYAPHEGRAQVFIVRGAHQLSISAANALLKTLEEPRPSTHFILLTPESERLLDTIRSRTLPVRFGPLPDEIVARVLRDAAVPSDRIEAIVALAGGSAGAALAAADPTLGETREAFVRAVVRAVAAPDLGDAVELGEAAPRDRHEMIDLLHALEAHYVREARAAGAAGAAELHARSHQLVLDALDAIDQRNGSASLVLASLVASLRHGFSRRPGDKPPIVVTRR
jgi:DNA polymerase III subunit delta'